MGFVLKKPRKGKSGKGKVSSIKSPKIPLLHTHIELLDCHLMSGSFRANAVALLLLPNKLDPSSAIIANINNRANGLGSSRQPATHFGIAGRL